MRLYWKSTQQVKHLGFFITNTQWSNRSTNLGGVKKKTGEALVDCCHNKSTTCMLTVFDTNWKLKSFSCECRLVNPTRIWSHAVQRRYDKLILYIPVYIFTCAQKWHQTSKHNKLDMTTERCINKIQPQFWKQWDSVQISWVCIVFITKLEYIKCSNSEIVPQKVSLNLMAATN